MSGVFLNKKFDDKQALEFFVAHSVCSIVSVASRNAVVIRLTLDTEKVDESPYGTIKLNYAALSHYEDGADESKDEDGAAEGTADASRLISIEPVTSLICKFVLLAPENIKGSKSVGDVVFLSPDRPQEDDEWYDAMRNTFSKKLHDLTLAVGLGDFRINITTYEAFYNEILIQKKIFYNSFMIDYQLHAICPDIVSTFNIDNNNIMDFLEKLNFRSDDDKFIFETFCKKIASIGEDYDASSDDSVDFLNNNGDEIDRLGGLNLGCIVMEEVVGNPLRRYYDDMWPPRSHARAKYVYSNDDGKKYNQYLNFKAKLLINLDKLHYLGFKHYDLHLDNAIVINPSVDCYNNCNVLLIDFGTSREMLWQTYISKMYHRLKKFRRGNGLEGEDFKGNEIDTLNSTNNAYNLYYIVNSVIGLENNPIIEQRSSGQAYDDWISYDRRIPNKLTEADKTSPQGLKMEFSKVIPIELLNSHYKLQAQQGKVIKDFLVHSLVSTSSALSEEEEEKFISDNKEMYQHKPLDVYPSRPGYYNRDTGAKELFLHYLEGIDYTTSCYNIMALVTENGDAVPCIDLFGGEVSHSLRPIEALIPEVEDFRSDVDKSIEEDEDELAAREEAERAVENAMERGAALSAGGAYRHKRQSRRRKNRKKKSRKKKSYRRNSYRKKTHKKKSHRRKYKI